MNRIEITPGLSIPEDEFEFSAARAGGPGGQHVNTTSTAVSVVFDVACSLSLSGSQRARILEKLASRIDSRGRLRLTASDTRSQAANRELVLARLVALLAGALKRDKPRRPTRPGKAAKARRMDAKKIRGGHKALRRPPGSDD